LTELEILRAIQSDLASVKTDMAGVKVDVRSHTGLLDILLQDVRLLRSAVNDIARTNVTSGEIGALHHDVNRVQQGLANLEARVEVIEAGRR
jgi:ubiquinone biosynthesis protein UbiJ